MEAVALVGTTVCIGWSLMTMAMQDITLLIVYAGGRRKA